MSIVGTERVLVVPTELFHQLGYFEGFTAHIDGYLEELLSPENTSYRPRSEMEQDPGYKQLIPYVIFSYTDQRGREHLFRYTRGTGQGEQRLHSKRSIGIGGHISSDDADGSRKRGQEPFAGNRPSGCFAQTVPAPFFSNFFSNRLHRPTKCARRCQYCVCCANVARPARFLACIGRGSPAPIRRRNERLRKGSIACSRDSAPFRCEAGSWCIPGSAVPPDSRRYGQ